MNNISLRQKMAGAVAGTVLCTVLSLSPTPVAQAAEAAVTTQITLSFDRLGYEWWGKPYFIEDPNRKNCDTDDSKRNLMLSVGVTVTNRSNLAMTPDSWEFVFARNTGQPAVWCFYRPKGQNSEPNITVWPGESVSIPIQVFMEPTERIRSVYVLDKRLGKSNTINISRTLPVPQFR